MVGDLMGRGVANLGVCICFSLVGLSRSGAWERSAKQRSGGIAMLRRLSSDTEEGAVDATERAEDSVSVIVGGRDCAAASWSFMMLISSFASTKRRTVKLSDTHIPASHAPLSSSFSR